ncbi:glucuronyl hydrolase [Pedobacter psychrophilus]|uniref:Glucuronyl hydrolase n=1 Tax=Pedobacter psychrophilus TaxID=1826909 RepID=A0A179DJ23_9SPHI|nr:glycoside hydrolase family 88 protein [Pedobacter psychrophilus]OAQ40782.1 glucuronyl hydrolase [Pedobacter psychrophilus]
MISGYKYFIISFLVVILLSFSNNEKEINPPIDHVFDTAAIQYKGMLESSKNLAFYPRTTDIDGKLKFVPISDWTGGFWPGSLWYMYEYTQDSFWKKSAMKWTKSLEKNQFNNTHHDLGFMMYNSYGNAFKLTNDSTLIPVLIQSAKSLISRYSPKVESIKSWKERTSPDGKQTWKFPVIIDNMMNLELLFFASKQTKNPIYRNIAIKHSETAMRNHVRPDYSSYHMVNYDENTGRVLDRKTVQGFSDNSLWARGQAWAVYGFTTVYRETKDQRFLVTAQKMANFYLNSPNLPEDKIPYWDFNVGQAGYKPEWNFDVLKYQPVPRDASAAAIMASALLELSTYSDAKLKTKYVTEAAGMLVSLSSDNYLANPGTNNHFLLKHSVGNMQKDSEVNVPLIYADYYFLEAMLRYNKITKF